jgi:hypothetical protein
MKLIREFVEAAEFLVEEASGKKNYFIEGIFLQSNIKNRNGRIYPESVMDKEVARYIAEKINTNSAMGELGHPETPSINLDRVSHLITSLKKEGTNYIGKAKILDTPNGKIARGILEGGGRLGVSSRALGTLVMNKEGVNVVQDDFLLSTAGDLVADPSAPDAFIRGIMENKEWVYIDGHFEERQINETKNIIHRTPSKRLVEEMSNEFEKFLKSLK